MEFMDSPIFYYLVLPLMIFLARISDVTIGTIRIIFLARGNKTLAPVLGFFEVLIWIIAISTIMKHLDNSVCYFAYAAGFATGNFVGIKLEERLAIGVLLVRIFAREESSRMTEVLHNAGYGTTVVKAKGHYEEVSILYSIVKRHDLKELSALIHSVNPDAFYTVEDIRSASHGIYGTKRPPLFRWKKGK